MIRQVSRVCLLAALAVWSCAAVHGASVEIKFKVGPPEFDACVICLPSYSDTVADGFVTTDADILSLNNFQVTPLADGRPIDLFNVDPPFGSDTAPPHPDFVQLNRALEYDSWVTTPGETTWTLPDGVDAGPWWSSGGLYPFEDDSNDGPQNMFHFARLAFQLGSGGIFSGEIVVAGENGPESFPFSIVVPEPSATMLLSVGVLVCANYQERSR